MAVSILHSVPLLLGLLAFGSLLASEVSAFGPLANHVCALAKSITNPPADPSISAEELNDLFFRPPEAIPVARDRNTFPTALDQVRHLSRQVSQDQRLFAAVDDEIYRARTRRSLARLVPAGVTKGWLTLDEEVQLPATHFVMPDSEQQIRLTIFQRHVFVGHVSKFWEAERSGRILLRSLKAQPSPDAGALNAAHLPSAIVRRFRDEGLLAPALEQFAQGAYYEARLAFQGVPAFANSRPPLALALPAAPVPVRAGDRFVPMLCRVAPTAGMTLPGKFNVATPEHVLAFMAMQDYPAAADVQELPCKLRAGLILDQVGTYPAITYPTPKPAS